MESSRRRSAVLVCMPVLIKSRTVPHRKGFCMNRRCGQAGYVMKKGGFWVGRYYADLPDGKTRIRKAISLGSVKEISKSEAKRKLRQFLEASRVNNFFVSTPPQGQISK